MERFEYIMTPLGILYSELMQINPSFVILYNQKTRKTCLMEGEIAVSEEDNLDMAILRAWNKIFGKRKDLGNGIRDYD
jgi:hypothetical protein